jgi:hypothetical protein
MDSVQTTNNFGILIVEYWMKETDLREGRKGYLSRDGSRARF